MNVPRILLVEDDALTARTTRRAIEWCLSSAQVDVCVDVSSAKRALKDHPYDVVISDFELPDGSGADVLACASSTRPDSPRILVTGHTEWTTATRAVNEGGAYRVVAKPWAPQDMRSVLVEALALKKARSDEKERKSDPGMVRATTNDWLRVHREALDRELVRRTEGLGAALLVALDRRLPGAERRSRQVAALAGWIATGMGLDEELVNDTRLAGFLHEIGALSFSDAEARLPDEARRVRAAAIGASMLGAIPALRGVQRIVREQSARFDGHGEGPKGTEIGIGARIVAACATFQALLVAHGTLDVKSHRLACDALQADAGRALDPRVVEMIVAQPLDSITRLMAREARK